MNEQQWRQGAGPREMLAFLQGKVSDRKLLLFACACCHRLRGVTRGKRNRHLLQALYDYADARIGFPQMQEAYRRWFHFDFPFPIRGTWQSALAKAACNPANTIMSACDAATEAVRVSKKPEQEQRRQVSLLHDLVGNPFRPVALDPAWRTTSVVTLAQAAYDAPRLRRRVLDPALLAILSDALKEAGCENTEVLAHLRRPAFHVAGCWAVDLVLSRE